MEDSILTSIKKMLGITESYEQFDSDLIMHINSVLSILMQLGIGSSSGFVIEDKTSTWSDFIGDEKRLSLVKSYMHLKVKLLFDPPLGSAVMECYKAQIGEFESRLTMLVDEINNETT